MTQGREPENFVDNEFLLAVLEDMYRPGFTEAYMLARKALLHGARMLCADSGMTETGEEGGDTSAQALRSLRDVTDLKTWLGIVSASMGSRIGKEEDGRLPIPYGWRWASDMVGLQEKTAQDTAEQKEEEEKKEELARRRRIEADGIEGRLRNLEEARRNIEEEAVQAAHMDFSGQFRFPGHGIVILSDGEVRTQMYTQPLAEDTALELEEAAEESLNTEGYPDEKFIFDRLSGEARDNIERVLEDNAAFHGYDPSSTGTIGTHIFMSKYFMEMIQVFLEKKITDKIEKSGYAEASRKDGKSRIVSFTNRKP